jgi:hypothetical protein
MAERTTLSGKELLVMLLYSPDSTGAFNVPIRGRTRLVKAVFLFEKELYRKFKFNELIRSTDLPDFKPWKFGPFSKDVYQNLDFLRLTGFIDVKATGESPAFEEVMERTHLVSSVLSEYDRSGDAAASPVSEFDEELFSLTEKGCAYAKDRVWCKLSSKQIEGLAAFKDGFVKAPLIAILKYVYENYKDQTAKSEIKERVLR